MTSDRTKNGTHSHKQSIGDFELREQLISDSMGDLYCASSPNLPQDVALRVFPAAVGEDKPYLDRLRQDIRKGISLRNPHLARILAMGISDEHPFLVMELVEGIPLSATLNKREGVPEREVLRVAIAVTDALTALHDAGLVHGNVTPANIVRGGDGEVKLINPGLLGPHRRNAMGGFLGSPLYIAPELIKGGDESPHCDMYSLGIILYYLLAGIPPFRSTDSSELFKEHLFAMVIPIGVRVPKLSLRTRDLIGRMMRRDPKDRYSGCHELYQELQNALQGLGPEPLAVPAVRPVEAPAAATPPAATRAPRPAADRPAPDAAPAAAAPRRHHHRLPRLLVVLAAELLIVGGVAFFAWFWEYGPFEKDPPPQRDHPVVPRRIIATTLPAPAAPRDLFQAATFSALSANFRRITPEWVNTTLGESASKGVTLWRGDRVTLIGNGSGLSAGQDNCRYLYTLVSTPYAFSLRVHRIATTHPRAMTGLLARKTTAPSSACVFFGFTGNGALQLYCRPTDGGKLALIRTAAPRSATWSPCFLKLERYADRFRAQVSADGETWEGFSLCQAGMAGDSTIGLAVASLDRDIKTSAECGEIRLLALAPGQP